MLIEDGVEVVVLSVWAQAISTPSVSNGQSMATMIYCKQSPKKIDTLY